MGWYQWSISQSMRYFYQHAYSLSSKNIWRDNFKYESVTWDLKADLHHKSLATNTGSFGTGDRCCITHSFPYDTAVVTNIPTTKNMVKMNRMVIKSSHYHLPMNFSYWSNWKIRWPDGHSASKIIAELHTNTISYTSNIPAEHRPSMKPHMTRQCRVYHIQLLKIKMKYS